MLLGFRMSSFICFSTASGVTEMTLQKERVKHGERKSYQLKTTGVILSKEI